MLIIYRSLIVRFELRIKLKLTSGCIESKTLQSLLYVVIYAMQYWFYPFSSFLSITHLTDRKRGRTNVDRLYACFNLMDKINILQVSCNLLSIFRRIFTWYTKLHDISSVILSAFCVIRKITVENCYHINKWSSDIYNDQDL